MSLTSSRNLTTGGVTLVGMLDRIKPGFIRSKHYKWLLEYLFSYITCQQISFLRCKAFFYKAILSGGGKYSEMRMCAWNSLFFVFFEKHHRIAVKHSLIEGSKDGVSTWVGMVKEFNEQLFEWFWHIILKASLFELFICAPK